MSHSTMASFWPACILGGLKAERHPWKHGHVAMQFSMDLPNDSFFRNLLLSTDSSSHVKKSSCRGGFENSMASYLSSSSSSSSSSSWLLLKWLPVVNRFQSLVIIVVIVVTQPGLFHQRSGGERCSPSNCFMVACNFPFSWARSLASKRIEYLYWASNG